MSAPRLTYLLVVVLLCLVLVFSASSAVLCWGVEGGGEAVTHNCS